jgi:hypothetical protein
MYDTRTTTARANARASRIKEEPRLSRIKEVSGAVSAIEMKRIQAKRVSAKWR